MTTRIIAKTYILLLLFACWHTGTSVVWAADYDLVIRNGLVIDGNRVPGRLADVGITGDRIAAVGDLADVTGAREIDAEGLVVAPGFINMLSWAVNSLIEDGRGLSDIVQGLTLEVFG
jgi:N-acyl-D-amino-acid deacylase